MEANRASFLSAEWRKLVMVNYSIDPEILREFVPAGTELDTYNDICYVSLVGFMFLRTKVKGISIPFHENFPEVNLRFYVRYKDGEEIKRGVVFIKRSSLDAITFVANNLYGEKYETMPMKYEWREDSANLEVSYRWKKSTWNSLTVVARRAPAPVEPLSEEDYITNHFWGYTRLSPVAPRSMRSRIPFGKFIQLKKSW